MNITPLPFLPSSTDSSSWPASISDVSEDDESDDGLSSSEGHERSEDDDWDLIGREKLIELEGETDDLETDVVAATAVVERPMTMGLTHTAGRALTRTARSE